MLFARAQLLAVISPDTDVYDEQCLVTRFPTKINGSSVSVCSYFSLNLVFFFWFRFCCSRNFCMKTEYIIHVVRCSRFTGKTSARLNLKTIAIAVRCVCTVWYETTKKEKERSKYRPKHEFFREEAYEERKKMKKKKNFRPNIIAYRSSRIHTHTHRVRTRRSCGQSKLLFARTHLYTQTVYTVRCFH